MQGETKRYFEVKGSLLTEWTATTRPTEAVLECVDQKELEEYFMHTFKGEGIHVASIYEDTDYADSDLAAYIDSAYEAQYLNDETGIFPISDGSDGFRLAKFDFEAPLREGEEVQIDLLVRYAAGFMIKVQANSSDNALKLILEHGPRYFCINDPYGFSLAVDKIEFEYVKPIAV